MFKENLGKKATEISEKLMAYIPEDRGYAGKVYEAMSYSFSAGGKRLRPMLLLEVQHLFGGEEKDALPFAAALEMIHTYSLIHDDLPAMDDDDYRRGKLTNHKVFGEDMAILAGDGLLNLAFETMSKACEEHVTVKRVRAMREIAECAGTKGMIGGQVVDILSEGQCIDKDQLLYIHENKTSKLLQCAMVAGACLGDAPEKDIENMREFGRLVGLAFQIQDDILDVESSFEELGKPIGSDAKNEKQTYVTMVGLQQAKKEVTALTEAALSLLNSYDREATDFLRELALFLTQRRH